MSNSFAISVQRAFFEFEATHDKKPTKLLLGVREKRWLDMYVRSFMRPAITMNDLKKRPQFHGLDVYEVDDEKFLAVA